MEKKLTPWCENVKIAMIEREWSVQDLADAVGMSRVYISSIIHGRIRCEKTANLISDTLSKREVKNPDSWHKHVKITLVKKGWGIKDLAKAANMSKGYVSAVVNDRVRSAPAVKTISDVLNIDATALSSDAN